MQILRVDAVAQEDIDGQQPDQKALAKRSSLQALWE
jgi:hypothetical protein